MAGRRVVLRLLLYVRDLRLSARVVTPAHPDRHAVDAAAGCEYVDDRIRLRE